VENPLAERLVKTKLQKIMEGPLRMCITEMHQKDVISIMEWLSIITTAQSRPLNVLLTTNVIAE